MECGNGRGVGTQFTAKVAGVDGAYRTIIDKYLTSETKKKFWKHLGDDASHLLWCELARDTTGDDHRNSKAWRDFVHSVV